MNRQTATPALPQNLNKIIDFLNENLNNLPKDVDEFNKNHIKIICEEIFINITRFAYDKKSGEARIIFEYCDAEKEFRLTFIDHGKKFNPVNIKEIDINIPIGQRKTGNLGLTLVKKLADRMLYTEEENGNKLVIFKKIKFDEEFNIIQEDLGKNKVILKIIGKITSRNLEKLSQEINKIFLDKKYDLTIDFKKVNFINSSGLKLLLKAQKRMNILEGQMCIINISREIMGYFIVTGFSKALKIIT